MTPIYISDENGELVDLSKLFDRVSKLERVLPVFDVPKQKRRKKSERERIIERKLKQSFQ